MQPEGQNHSDRRGGPRPGGREGSVGFGGCALLPLHGVTSPSSTLPSRPLLALQNLPEPSCALGGGAPFSGSVPPCTHRGGASGEEAGFPPTVAPSVGPV